MKVDDDIEPGAAKLESGANIVTEPSGSPASLKHDDVVETGMMPEHRLARGFDDVCELRAGIDTAERADERRREDDVADESRPDEQDLQGSIVASSISITGISSLIGYTR